MRAKLADEFKFNQPESLNLLEKCKELGETNLFSEVLLFLGELLLDSEDYENTLKLLNNKEFIKAIDQKNIFMAQREYLLGKIALVIKDEKLKSPIDYFEYAYSLIENQSINELTWKVLYILADTFWERGNFHKAKKPRLYAIELLEMISEHIPNNKIRTAYKERKDRKQVIEKLKLMGDTAQLNEFQKS
jgi:tetratricopeptide (TPR) repeat protein